MHCPASAETSRIILSLMSGTSVDSIDAAICRVWQRDAKLDCEVLAFREHPISPGLRERIFRVFQDEAGSLALACSLNFEIAQAFAHAALAVVRQWDGDHRKIDAIASHGQTLYHIAPHMVAEAAGANLGWVASTLQVGEGAVISALTGLPVISNFRVADMAVGGNGAPLVPFADYHLLSRPGEGIVVHNLGGIGNCTWLPPSGEADDVIAFDTGPANMIIDGLVSHFYPGETYDANGSHAAGGTVNSELLSRWMEIGYITQPPPKSTGRELFGRQFVERIIAEHPAGAADDLIATATEFTALSLVENLVRFVEPRGHIDRIILAGGGARNGYLVGRIAGLWSGRASKTSAPGKAELDIVVTLDSLGLPITSKSRECVGFALLGFAHLAGIPGNLPGVTGAKCPVVLGDYTPILMNQH